MSDTTTDPRGYEIGSPEHRAALRTAALAEVAETLLLVGCLCGVMLGLGGAVSVLLGGVHLGNMARLLVFVSVSALGLLLGITTPTLHSLRNRRLRAQRVLTAPQTPPGTFGAAEITLARRRWRFAVYCAVLAAGSALTNPRGVKIQTTKMGQNSADVDTAGDEQRGARRWWLLRLAHLTVRRAVAGGGGPDLRGFGHVLDLQPRSRFPVPRPGVG